MFIKQLSVFVENKGGRLAEITSVMANADINIRGLSIADTTDFGILRLIVDNPVEAEKKLKAAGLTVSLSEVIAVSIPDKMGGFAETMKAIADKDVGVEYVYEFVPRSANHAYFVLRVADNEKAIAALKAHGCELLEDENI